MGRCLNHSYWRVKDISESSLSLRQWQQGICGSSPHPEGAELSRGLQRSPQICCCDPARHQYCLIEQCWSSPAYLSARVSLNPMVSLQKARRQKKVRLGLRRTNPCPFPWEMLGWKGTPWGKFTFCSAWLRWVRDSPDPWVTVTCTGLSPSRKGTVSTGSWITHASSAVPTSSSWLHISNKNK